MGRIIQEDEAVLESIQIRPVFQQWFFACVEAGEQGIHALVACGIACDNRDRYTCHLEGTSDKGL